MHITRPALSSATAKATMAALLLALSACAPAGQNTADAGSEPAAYDQDPLEPVNRAIFQFNTVVDQIVLRPVTQGYQAVVPEKGREMVSNAVSNLYMPLTMFNSALQGDVENTFASFWRFMINSSVGIGGLFDVASEIPLKARTTDLGQTFAMYGAGPGAYVVLPIIGPSTTRDSFGRLGDAVMNPFNHMDNDFSYVMWGATALDARSRNATLIDDIYRTSLDPYSTFRSGYLQKRAADIRRAKEARDKSQEKSGF
jgi:phospholipid-binding lipoprotein MlaA